LGRHSEREFVTIWSAVMRCVHPEPGYRIEQPLLLTHGEHDNLGLGAIKQHMVAWAARDPNCRYVIIPNAAHNPHQENPDFFNPLLLQFLREYVPALL
jgi:pimeloyl-ACP methyl ester carboxylesterase